jgi:putative flippase GtrA
MHIYSVSAPHDNAHGILFRLDLNYYKVMKYKNNLKRIAKFLVSGGVSAGVEFVSFLLLIMVTSVVLGNGVSFLIGLGTSFLLNKNWVFEYKKNSLKIVCIYVLLAVLNLIIGSLLISQLENYIDAWIAKIVVMIVIAAWNYIIYSKYIFHVPSKHERL